MYSTIYPILFVNKFHFYCYRYVQYRFGCDAKYENYYGPKTNWVVKQTWNHRTQLRYNKCSRERRRKRLRGLTMLTISVDFCTLTVVFLLFEMNLLTVDCSSFGNLNVLYRSRGNKSCIWIRTGHINNAKYRMLFWNIIQKKKKCDMFLVFETKYRSVNMKCSSCICG